MSGGVLARGLRRLARAPGAVGTAVVTLGVAIGANVLLFAAVRGILHPVAYPDAQRLVVLWSTNPAQGIARSSISAADFHDVREAAHAFSAMAAMRRGTAVLEREKGEAQEVSAAEVSASFFELLGTPPALGRYFKPEEVAAGGSVVLGSRLWHSAFGGSGEIVGKTVRLDDRPVTVVGVAPPELVTPGGAEAWLATAFGREEGQRGGRSLTVLARLRPGRSESQAAGELRGVAAGLAKQFPDTNRGWSLGLTPLEEEVGGPQRSAVVVLFGAVWLFLAAACVNVASLLLARAVARDREMAIRLALGARRGHLVRWALGESGAVALAGGALGVLLSRWIPHLLALRAPRSLGRFAVAAAGWQEWAYSFGLLCVVAAGCGLLPALRALHLRRVWLQIERLRAEAGRVLGRFQRVLLVGQVAVTAPLVVGFLVLAQSFLRLDRIAPGFDARGVTVARINLSAERYAAAPRRADYVARAVEQVRRLPGVAVAGCAADLPLGGSIRTSSFVVQGAAPPPAGELPLADIHAVTPGYFAALRIAVLRGRLFAPAEVAAGHGVAVLNRTAERRFFGGEDPIGRHLAIGGWAEERLYGHPLDREIVGIVEDVRQRSLSEPPGPEIFVPVEQVVSPALFLLVRSAAGSAEVARSLRQVVSAVDRGVPVGAAVPLEQVVGRELEQARLQAALLGSFAALALLVAAAGIYAIVSDWTLRRRFEVGVRMALGADRAAILRWFLGRSLRLAACGVLLGGVLSSALLRLLAHTVFGIGTADGPVYVGAALVVLGAALAASLGPSLRSVRLDPVAVLRVA
ncbi:MAG TPA: ABC transporter permease [Thermoanaerobaculia bacterium]|nr:ABC transporter permease [Thermoanaerobaculia bacterium]